MDGCSPPAASDGRRFADRRNLCAGIPVLSARASGTVDQDPEFCAAVAAAFSKGGRMEIDPVFASVGGADGRDRHASDGAVRRNRLRGRNDDRYRPAARRAFFGGCRTLYAESAAQTAIGPTETRTAYRDRGAAFDAYVPPRCADRQRKSSERTVERTARRSDRSDDRSSAAAGSVSEAFRKRRSFGGTSDFGYADGVRERVGRLYLRAGADADRNGAGDSAGDSVTV